MHEALYLTQYREIEYAAKAPQFIAAREHQLAAAAAKAKQHRARRPFGWVAALRLPVIGGARVAVGR